MNTVLKTMTCVLLGVAALAACKPVDAQQSGGSGTAGVDVVIATGMSRSGTEETHYAECAADPNARLGDYRVIIPPELDYGGLPEGSPCPAGPRELSPQDKYPELFAEMSEAVNEPLPYEGGDPDTCGTWGTVDPAEARQMLAECPPLTRGDLK